MWLFSLVYKLMQIIKTIKNIEKHRKCIERFGVECETGQFIIIIIS